MGKLEQLREPSVVELQQLQGAQGLDAGGVLCGVGELPCGEGVLVDGDGGIGGLGSDRGRSGMIVCLSSVFPCVSDMALEKKLKPCEQLRMLHACGHRAGSFVPWSEASSPS